MQREDKIYMAYKVVLASKRKSGNPAADILALIHTANSFKITLLTMMDIVKRHKRNNG